MRFTDLHINIKIRIIEVFLSVAVGSMIFPFMAIYFGRYFSMEIVGIILLSNTVLSFFSSIYGGYLADAIGRKKIMLSGEIIRFISILLMILSNSPWFFSPSLTIVSFLINGIIGGVVTPATQAMLIDVCSPEERKFMFSINYWALNLSLTVGTILGGILFNDYLFYLLISLGIVSFIIIMLVSNFIKESYIPIAKTSNSLSLKAILYDIGGHYKIALKDKIFILFTIGSTLILSQEKQLINYISLFLDNNFYNQFIFNWKIEGTSMLSILRIENSIFAIVFGLFVAKFLQKNKISDNFLLLSSGIVFCLGYAMLTYTTNAYLLMIFMMFITLSEVIKIPIEQSYLADLPPSNLRSSYLALYSLRSHLALGIASFTVFISGFLNSFMMTIFILSSGLFGVMIYAYIFYSLSPKKAYK